MKDTVRLLLCITHFVCLAWSTESNMFSAFPRQLTIPKNMKVRSIARGLETVLFSASITTETPIGELTETYLMNWTNKYGPFERIDDILFSPDGESVAISVMKNRQSEWFFGRSSNQKTYLHSVALPFSRGAWTHDSRFINLDHYRYPSVNLNAPRVLRSAASGNSATIFKSNLGTYISSGEYTIGPYLEVYSAGWDSKGLRLVYSFSTRSDSQHDRDGISFWLNIGSRRIGPFEKIQEIRYSHYPDGIFYCESNQVGMMLTNGVEWKRVSVSAMDSLDKSQISSVLYMKSTSFCCDRLFLLEMFNEEEIGGFSVCKNDFGKMLDGSVGNFQENPPLEFVRIGWRCKEVGWSKYLGVPVVAIKDFAGDGKVIAFPTIAAIRYSGSFNSGKLAMLYDGVLYAE